jgi:hypothetical protein
MHRNVLIGKGFRTGFFNKFLEFCVLKFRRSNPLLSERRARCVRGYCAFYACRPKKTKSRRLGPKGERNKEIKIEFRNWRETPQAR